MKCKNCKDKFTPKTFLQKFCMEKPECVEIFVSEVKAKQWKKKKAEMKKELMTLSDYSNALQVVFNKWIRKRDEGLPCISCGTLNGKRDCGHFYSVGNYPSVRFDEENCAAQCVHCNQFRGGNIHDYRVALYIKLGKEKFEALEKRAHESRKYSIPEIKEMIEKYKNLLK
jgi:hypothetical protein